MVSLFTPDDDQGLNREFKELRLLSGRKIELSYLSAGDPQDPQLIYVHGTPGDAAGTRAFLENPVHGRHSIVIDRPGFGKSYPEATPNYEEQAHCIQAIMKQVNGVAPLLIGHSLGGPIITRVAVDYPEQVGGLLIIAGAIDPALEKPQWYNHLINLPIFQKLMPKRILNSNIEIMQAPAEARKLSSRLSQLICPVVILHGRHDLLVPYANVAYMQQHFVNAHKIKVMTLDRAGHPLIWTHETEVRSAIQSALELNLAYSKA